VAGGETAMLEREIEDLKGELEEQKRKKKKTTRNFMQKILND